MLTTNIIEPIAKAKIPEGTHKLLHVNSRKAWVKIVKEVVNKNKIKSDKAMLMDLAKNWETVLYHYYSQRN